MLTKTDHDFSQTAANFNHASADCQDVSHARSVVPVGLEG